jgi:hypothetical protein
LGERVCVLVSQPEYAASGALSSVWSLRPDNSKNRHMIFSAVKSKIIGTLLKMIQEKEDK